MNTFHPLHRFMTDAAINKAKIDRARAKASPRNIKPSSAEYDDEIGRPINLSNGSSISNRELVCSHSSHCSIVIAMNTFHPLQQYVKNAPLVQAQIERARASPKQKDSKGKNYTEDEAVCRGVNLSSSSVLSNRVSSDSTASTASNLEITSLFNLLPRTQVMNTFHPYRQYMNNAPLLQAQIDRARKSTDKRSKKSNEQEDDGAGRPMALSNGSSRISSDSDASSKC
ncbi:hypothetical protein THRCLA_23283 [Thraustotheca clavata]|uniref:Uncharacterized protein n=1 Tax=Thraustotheca clavata TaxID=74557 RepID=A0A1V9Y890_9STRA|nr:hypothetical protein THRCLA_23283 [Thraustotheca clavata]